MGEEAVPPASGDGSLGADAVGSACPPAIGNSGGPMGPVELEEPPAGRGESMGGTASSSCLLRFEGCPFSMELSNSSLFSSLDAGGCTAGVEGGTAGVGVGANSRSSLRTGGVVIGIVLCGAGRGTTEDPADGSNEAPLGGGPGGPGGALLVISSICASLDGGP